jgi:hypothetical protein
MRSGVGALRGGDVGSLFGGGASKLPKLSSSVKAGINIGDDDGSGQSLYVSSSSYPLNASNIDNVFACSLTYSGCGASGLW